MKLVYQKEIGYSPLQNVDIEKKLLVIKVCKELINDYYNFRSSDKILVAGTGTGEEAALIFNEFNLITVGVDINIKYHGVPEKREGFSLHKQNLTSLGFCDNSFSLIYCYHVLEHVDDPFAVLKEFNRVLKPEGILFIGFPNKHRVIAYLGTSQTVTIREKLVWNITDYRLRISGKFENKYGAHAGFTEREFINIASNLFTCVIPVRNQYILLKYKHFRVLGRLIIISKLSEVLFPSNYFICAKN